MYVENQTGNNRIMIFGTLANSPVFSHDVYGEAFYTLYLDVSRLSQASDRLPVTVSERLINLDEFVPDVPVFVLGQVRSYNSYIEEEKRNKLILTVFAKECQLAFSTKEQKENPNEAFLDGYICKPPVYRTTPFGREIADLLIAVNRSYNKSDYIPCITWGRNARFSSRLEVGDNIRLWGRMQSRNYQKKISEGEFIEKTAYEISVSKIELSENVAENSPESLEENVEKTPSSEFHNAPEENNDENN